MIISTFSNQFTILLSGVDLLLKHEDYFHVTPGGLSDTFIEGLYETYSLAFDVTVSLDKLKALHPTSGTELTMADYAAFLVKTLDNDDAYKLLNYYTVQFIKAAVETATDEKREEVMGLLESVDITPEMLQSVEDEYSKLKDAKKTKTSSADTKVLDNPAKVPYSDSMVTFSDEERTKMYDSLVELLTSALERGEMTVEQSEEAARFILSQLEKVKGTEELQLFAEDLSKRWSIFSPILTSLKMDTVKAEEQQEIGSIKDKLNKLMAQQ